MNLNFPEVIDSTMRSSWVACRRQFFYTHILNLRKPGPSIHLHFGGCVARGLEITRKSYWQNGLDEINSITAGITALIRQWGDFEIPESVVNSRAGVKTLGAAIDSLVSYFEHYPLGSDVIRPLMLRDPANGNEVAMIEKSFALPIPRSKHPQTGDPILFAGRFDMLGWFQDAIFVIDEKTSTALGERWRSNWTLRGQLSAYCWGARSFLADENVSGAIIRGIGVMKQSINFAEGIYSRPEWQIEQWLRQLMIDVNGMVESYRMMCDLFADQPHMAFDQAFDSACSAYAGCPFVELCDSPDPTPWYDNYEVRVWDPLMRQGDDE